MESLRRPSVLAALAAVVLVINVIVLAATGDVPGVAVDDPLADATAPEDDPTAQDGAAGEASGQDAQDQAPSEDGGDSAAEGGAAAGDDGAAADSGDGGAASDEDASGGRLGVPVAGTYTYASSGSWSLSGGSQPEEHELPGTATGTVQVEGDAWQVRLAAGDRYADRFGFARGPDGGLDWVTWVLERKFGEDPTSETSYGCSGDSAYYRPDEQGRVVAHDCASDAGITSAGQVEHVGREDVTLGDGTVVGADRLLYTYTVSGSGEGFEVTGEGRLDLWVDPATGLRLREQRTISTTTTSATGEQVYREAVEFILQSLQPA